MITKFKLFESYDEVKSICDKYNIKNWEVNPETGRVDVEGDVNLSGMELKKIPLEFGEIGGYFYCGDNQLASLRGGPNSVGGDFNCRNNQLTSLEGSPNSVGGNFWCNYNQLVDFMVPEYSINDDVEFRCEMNPIFEIYQLFNSPKCIDLINEFEVIRPNKVIIRDRLEEVFSVLGMEIPEFKFKEWKLVD